MEGIVGLYAALEWWCRLFERGSRFEMRSYGAPPAVTRLVWLRDRWRGCKIREMIGSTMMQARRDDSSTACLERLVAFGPVRPSNMEHARCI
jgi:hypothetical protein